MDGPRRVCARLTWQCLLPVPWSRVAPPGATLGSEWQVSVNEPHARRHVHDRTQAQGDLGQVLSRARGPRVDGWVGGGSVSHGGPGHCVGWVIFHGEFVPRGLLNVLELPGLPLPHPLHLRRGRGTGPLSRLGGTTGLGRKSRTHPGRRPRARAPGQPTPSPCTAGHRDPTPGPAATRHPEGQSLWGQGEMGLSRVQRGCWEGTRRAQPGLRWERESRHRTSREPPDVVTLPAR